LIHARNARRHAHAEYGTACERFKERRGIDRLDIADPKFRRATRKAYEAYVSARAVERNAMRRLETAVHRMGHVA
jgi:hypothetical protein